MGNNTPSDQTVAPHKTIAFGDGKQASWYMLPFDRDGNCTGPRHRAAALAEAASEKVTDVFVCSHGWKNNWREATERYAGFIDGFRRTHVEGHGLAFHPDYQPLIIGVFWPSVILVAPGEQAPAIAGGGDDAAAIAELAAALPPAQGERLAALLSGGELDLDRARELAELAMALFVDDEDDAPETWPPPTPDDLLTSWQANAGAEPERDEASFGTVSEDWAAAPEAAGFSLDPRKLVNLLTVRSMKDRAGVVGARGVGPLLRDLLAAGGVRVHVIGHSYGAKVCMSAICSAPLPAGAKVDSLLLLQPAVNHRCFAADAGEGRPGGYRAALERVNKPIMTTYSAHDDALRNWFHHALTRRSDALEAAIAALPGVPSPYAALGGYGPRGADPETEQVDLLDPGVRYSPADRTRLLAIDATRGISNHGDISNAYTWWALCDQVAQP